MISRRQMLSALGLGAGSLFLPSLRRGRGLLHADPSEPPKRLIIVGTIHGTVHENWNMRPAGLTGPEGSDWEFSLTTPDLSFSRILAPYAPLAKKMIVVDGLAQYSSIASGGNGHYTGAISAFTGTIWRDLGSDVITAAGPSVDQIVAKQIARPDRIRSLELGHYHRAEVFDEQGIELPVEFYPSNLFKRLFGQTVVGSSDDDLVTANQRSVLDAVAAQYASLGAQLSKADSQKLAQHQQLIRDLEKRLAGLAAVQCNVPMDPGDPDFTMPTGLYKKWFEAFAQLVVAAFSCDLTRVVSLQIEGPNTDDIGAPPGDIHDLYAHHSDDCPDQNADGIEYMTRFHTYDTSLVAGLATLLDSVPEGNGTMLDNTLILTGGELASGGHSYFHLPHVMIGNVGGHFKTGRYVHYGQRLPIPYGGGYERAPIGPPHSKMLTAIAQAFGVNTNLVGAPNVTLEGRSIDLSGALERLS